MLYNTWSNVQFLYVNFLVYIKVGRLADS